MTQKEYEATKKRVEKGATALEGQFLSEDPKVKSWVAVYNELALSLLQYEIQHDLLPI